MYNILSAIYHNDPFSLGTLLCDLDEPESVNERRIVT